MVVNTIGRYAEEQLRLDASIMYGLRAVNMLTVIEDTAIDGESKEVESLVNEMNSIFDKNIDLSEYKRRGTYFYYA